MRCDEVALAIELAAAEGWNPGLNDADCFFAADADGFLVGELAGRGVGCISAVSYAGTFGFIGLYIVRPEFRGRGYGMRLWQAGMERLQGHNVGLDGVVARQANYAKSGFRLAHRNVRYRGALRRRKLLRRSCRRRKSDLRRCANMIGKYFRRGGMSFCGRGSVSRRRERLRRSEVVE